MKNMSEDWIVRRRKYLLERKWLKLREDHVVLPTGVEIEEYHVIECPDWAAILCLTERGEVVMVNQYRHGIEKMSLELPAGVIESNEDPLEGAKRELLEETGFVSDDWRLLSSCSPDPSRSNNTAWLYIAKDAKKVAEISLDASENLEVVFLTPAELKDVVQNGEIVHAIHLAAIWQAIGEGVLG